MLDARDESVHATGRRRWPWESAIRPAIAGLLVLTALLKAASPATAVATAAAYGLSYEAVVVVVLIELMVAALLVSGWRPRLAIAVAGSLFSLFAAYSLVLTFAGVSSCGCFGSLPVNPRVTFILDVFVVGALAMAWRSTGGAGSSPVRGLAVAVAFFWIGGAALYVMAVNRPTTLAAGQAIEPGVGVVVLEPEQWIGDRFPIGQYLQPQVRIDGGRWVFVLYHHDCPACQAALPSYEQLAESLSGEPDRQVGLIEVPPYGPRVDRGRAHALRLPDNVEWFVEAPVEVIVEDGVVKKVSRELSSASGQGALAK